MINPIPELTPLLKQLRLSGMTDSLATRNREAIENQLSYPDFLALLVQDEVARRDQKKYATRLRRAGFRGNKTLESFDVNASPNINRAYINELADCRFIEEKVAVLIAGPCGTGKSHLAQAIGHCAVKKKALMCCSSPKLNCLPTCMLLEQQIPMINASRHWQRWTYSSSMTLA